jgi:hypothetical protein
MDQGIRLAELLDHIGIVSGERFSQSVRPHIDNFGGIGLQSQVLDLSSGEREKERSGIRVSHPAALMLLYTTTDAMNLPCKLKTQ